MPLQTRPTENTHQPQARSKGLVLAVAVVAACTGSSVGAQVKDFNRTLDRWLRSAPEWKAHAFEATFPSAHPSSTGCTSDPGEVSMPVDGGTLTLASSDGACPLRDGTSSSPQSDGTIYNGERLTLTFDPPIHSFYTYASSLASGHVTQMSLRDPAGDLIPALLVTAVSTDNVSPVGYGFVSQTPVRTIELTATEPGTVHLGRFVGSPGGEVLFEGATGTNPCDPYDCDFAFARNLHQPLVFLTPTTGSGDLSSWPEANGEVGIAAGDAICQHHAEAAGFANNDAFVALLSDSSHDVGCRLSGMSGTLANNCNLSSGPQGAGPWWRPDGKAWGPGLELLDVWALRRPTQIDASGETITNAAYFTGSLTDLSVDPDATCSDWSTTSGNARTGVTSIVIKGWIEGAETNCSFPRRLVCLEAAEALPLLPEPIDGRVAFLSQALGPGDILSWPEVEGPAMTGVEAADSICQAEALAAGLDQPGSFLALLSTDTVDAFERLTNDGRWSRADGVRIANSLSYLERGDWQTGLAVAADGTTAFSRLVWTGLAPPEEPALNCSNWESASPNGHLGRSDFSGILGSRIGSALPCSSPSSIYCFSNALDPDYIFADGFGSGDLTSW